MFTWRTQVLTESAGVSRRAGALSGHMVAGRPVLALAFLLAPVTIGAPFTGGLTAPASESRGADAGSGDGVTQRPILALTSAAAVGTPVAAVTGAGAVGAPPSWFALTGVGGHTAAVNTALLTVGSTRVSVLLEAWAALGLPPVHGFLSSPISQPITDPVSGALEPVEDISAAGVVNLIIRMGVGLLHRHRVTLPVAADVGILQVEAGNVPGQVTEDHGQKERPEEAQRRGHLSQSCT